MAEKKIVKTNIGDVVLPSGNPYSDKQYIGVVREICFTTSETAARHGRYVGIELRSIDDSLSVSLIERFHYLYESSLTLIYRYEEFDAKLAIDFLLFDLGIKMQQDERVTNAR